jgi:hypothetical protein
VSAQEKVANSASYQKAQQDKADATIARYEYAVGQGYSGSLMDFMASGEGGSVSGGGSFISTADIAKTDEAKQLAGIVELQTAIKNYDALIAEFGGASIFTPNDRQKLNSAKEAINLAIKNAEGLGALQAPDIELVKRMILRYKINSIPRFSWSS